MTARARRATTIRCSLLVAGLFAGFFHQRQAPVERPGPVAPDTTTRAISFSTTEGTWISLDVSPDGRTIVFELLGDLYTLPIDGGTATPIVRGTAFQSQPRFSPDGKSLAFVSDESGSDNLWITTAAGTEPRQVTTLPRSLVISPAWSPDGRSLYATVVESRDAAEIWRFDAASGAGEKLVPNRNGTGSLLVSTPAPGVYGPVASPDGRTLWYASVTPSVARSVVRAQSRVARLDLASRRESPVTLDIGIAMKPLFSPDGRTLVYGASSRGATGLRVRDLATGAERWLHYPTLRNELEARASRDVLPNAAFTPDGKAVIAAFGGRIHRLALDGSGDRIIPFTARVDLAVVNPSPVTHRLGDATVKGRLPRSLALSRDGSAAFSVFARIYHRTPNDTTPRRLTNTLHPREFMPAWSPDGRWIAYVTWGPTGGHLWKAPVGGGEPVRLSSAAGLWVDPVWLATGDSIVAIRAPTSAGHAAGGVPADADVVILSSAGGSERIIGPAQGARRPHLGPNPRRIFASAGPTLVDIGLDDGSRSTVASLPPVSKPFSAGPSELRASPAGDQLLALFDERLYLLPRPGDATRPLALDGNEVVAIGDGAPTSFAWAPDGRSASWLTGSRLQSIGATGGPRREVPLAVELPRATPRGTVVIRGATVITMRGNEVVSNADVVVTDDRIVGLGRRGTVAIPPRARIIDAAGKFVIPGFVDVHAHTGFRHELLEPENSMGYASLAFGTTTLRDPQTGPDIFPMADLIEIGEAPGPRMLSTGPGIFAERNLPSLEATRTLLTRYRDDYGTHLIKSYIVGNRQQRQWMVQACRELGLIPTTEGGADTKMDLTHAIDGFSGNEHSVPTTPVYRDVVELLARSGISYTPTLLVTFGGALPIYLVQPRERAYRNAKLRRFIPDEELYRRSASTMLRHADEDYNYVEASQAAAAIVRAGGRVALGGHGEMPGLQVQWEMGLLADGGMAPHDILRVATLEGARALGIERDVGSVEPGKLADLIVLDRNPLRDIHATAAIRYVMKNGELYDGETLDRVWPTPRALPTPWWRLDH